MSHQPHNLRELTSRLGIGNFNATMVIQIMFTAPATTDPKSPGTMLLVRHLQKRLASMGYSVPQNGYLDAQTAEVIRHVCGAGWESQMWSTIARRIADASEAPATVNVKLATPSSSDGALSGITDMLPDVPGGAFTYLAAAAAAVYFWKNKR